jgi:hypothetical protein
LKFHVPYVPVVSQELTGENIYTLTIASQEIAREAQPGIYAVGSLLIRFYGDL